MYPVFVVNDKIAFSTDIYIQGRGNHMHVGFRSLMTPWGLFIPMCQESFNILEYLKSGGRNLTIDLLETEGMLLDHRGTLKLLRLHRSRDFDKEDGNMPEMMDDGSLRYHSVDRATHNLDQIVIPYAGGFRVALSDREIAAGRAEVALALHEDIEDVADAYIKGIGTGPCKYIIFKITDAVKWMKENTNCRPIPWNWKISYRKPEAEEVKQ